MEIQSLADAAETTIHVRGELTIYDALQWKNSLQDALNKHDVVKLDLGELAEIDTAGVQVLVALIRTAKQINRKVLIVDGSQAVMEIIHLCNLDQEISLASN
jgi:anti-sigma B factor antagonist